jgi:hypothetical protein
MSIVYIGDYLSRRVEKERQAVDSMLEIVKKFQDDGKGKFVDVPLTKAKEHAKIKRMLQQRMNRHFAIAAKAHEFNMPYNNFPAYVRMELALKQAAFNIRNNDDV